MSLAFMLIVQASAALAVPDAAGFDLGKTVPAKACTKGGEEIVVCGRKADDEAFRLRALPPVAEPALPRAVVGVGRGTVGIETENVTFGDGSVSKRAMVKLKVPF